MQGCICGGIARLTNIRVSLSKLCVYSAVSLIVGRVNYRIFNFFHPLQFISGPPLYWNFENFLSLAIIVNPPSPNLTKLGSRGKIFCSSGWFSTCFFLLEAVFQSRFYPWKKKYAILASLSHIKGRQRPLSILYLWTICIILAICDRNLTPQSIRYPPIKTYLINPHLLQFITPKPPN